VEANQRTICRAYKREKYLHQHVSVLVSAQHVAWAPKVKKPRKCNGQYSVSGIVIDISISEYMPEEEEEEEEEEYMGIHIKFFDQTRVWVNNFKVNDPALYFSI
jgi:hypothetical protein